MAKHKKKQEPKTQKSKKIPSAPAELEVSFKLSNSAKYIIIVILVLLSCALPVYYVWFAYSVNHDHGFPLDDPWIHLQFARNLVEHGSFSYFKNEIVTSGSTSPLYTFLLAGGFLFTKNEMILSYVLGIIFFAVSVFGFYLLSSFCFQKENWLALAAVLIFVLDRWLNFISVAGMETTMYIFLLVLCFYYYRKRNAALFAVTLGLTFWSRPDAVAFLGAVIIDYALFIYMKKKSPKANELRTFTKRELVKIVIISLFLLLGYFAFNLILSGSVLPNTYGAKLTYYAPETRSRADFLKFEVWQYFTDSAYVLLIIPFLIAVLLILTDSVRLRYNIYLLPLIFIAAFVFMYWYKLPYAHRFGRYLMPIIPFYILMFIYGTRELFKFLYKYFTEKTFVNSLNYIFIGITIVYFASSYYPHRELFAEQTRHISIRQVAAGKWLKDNTPGDAIIATHDVGAVAYYSNRKIVDVAGLISPEFIKKLLDRDFSTFMVQEMKKQNVSYIAFLREWYQVVNQPALLVAGDKNFEIMEVYKFDPQKTHVLSREVNSINEYAMQLLQNKQVTQAINILNRSISLDPASSLTYFLLAYAFNMSGDVENAAKNLIKAVEIFPGYRGAVFMLADILKKQSRIPEARRYTENYLKINPNDTSAAKLLSSLPDSVIVK
jgi:tetratricopeptide (TPR) repeat protein